MNLTDLQSVTVTNHTNLIPKIFWVLILVYMELYSRSFRSVITAGWYTAYLGTYLAVVLLHVKSLFRVTKGYVDIFYVRTISRPLRPLCS